MRKLTGKSWLEYYMDYTADDESPENFRWWSGIAALSSSLKRRIYGYRGKYKIYPNQYIVLVGPPAVGKGVAMNPALDIAKEANTCHFLEDRVTAEKVADLLAGGFQAPVNTATGGVNIGVDHCATAVAPELSVFLSASDWYLQFLCTLWDKNEFTNATKKGGVQTIKDNCFGLFGACTPDYIRKINKDTMAAVAGGFTSRTIFAFASKKAKSEAWPDPADMNLKQNLVEDMKYIAMLGGMTGTEVRFTPEAKKVFADFYNKVDSSGNEFDMEVITNFRGRMSSHVFKNSMILSVAEKDDLVIEKHHVEKAIIMVEEILNTLDITFRGVGESNLADATDRIMSFIEAKKKCARSEILRYNYRHVTAEDLDRILTTLSAMQFCFETVSGNSVHYTWNSNFDPAKVISQIKQTKGAGVP